MGEGRFRAILHPDEAGAEAAKERACGGCTACCTVLRVDALRKLGGVPCAMLDEDRGCGVYQERPKICRAYRCLWLQGAFEEADRPDRIGAVLDLLNQAGAALLAVRESTPRAASDSPRLSAIIARYRSFMPVRISDARDAMNPDARFRLLLPGGEERIIEGDEIRILREGREAERRRMPWLRRRLRRGIQRVRRWRLRNYGAGALRR